MRDKVVLGKTRSMTSPRVLSDGTLGDWINQRLLSTQSAWGRVGSAVPTGFPRVVRVLHPTLSDLAWAEIAKRTSKVMHPLVQWDAIADGMASGEEPPTGNLPPRILTAILDHCPTDDEVIYAVWVGWGTWADSVHPNTLMPGWGGRDYRLFSGPKAAHTTWPGMEPRWWKQTASLIWPIDRSWCIASEIDWDSTLVACSTAIADAILDDPRLEAFDVAYDSDLSINGDTVNTV